MLAASAGQAHSAHRLVEIPVDETWLHGRTLAQAAELAPVKIDTDGVLPQDSVTALAEDHEGRLWIGTQAGVATYDSRRFVAVVGPWRVAPWVTRIWIAPNGAVWIATREAGLARLENDRWTVIDTARGLPADSVRDVIGHDGKVYAATTGGLAEIVGDNVRAVQIPGMAVPTALAEDTGVLLVGTERGLWRDEQERFVRYGGAALDQSHVLTLSGFKPGQPLWAGTSMGLFRVEGGIAKKVAVDRETSNRPVTALAWTQAEAGTWSLWAGFWGAGVAHLAADRWVRVADIDSEMAKVWALAAHHGAPGLVWIGLNAGLRYVPVHGWRVFPARAPDFVRNPIDVRIAAEGSVWITNGSRLVLAAGPRLRAFVSTDTADLMVLPAPGTWRGRQLWLEGLRSGSINAFDGERWQRTDFAASGHESYVFALLQTGGESGLPEFFAGYRDGLWALNDGLWSQAGPERRKGHVTQILRTHGADGETAIWVATADASLWRYQHGQWRTYDAELGPSVISLAVSHLANGHELLWMATTGSGLAVVDLADESNGMVRINEANTPAFPSNVLYSVAWSRDLGVFASTTRGVVQLEGDPFDASLEVRTFAMADGLPDVETSYGGLAIDREDRVWAATGAGLAVLDARDCRPDHAAKRLSLDRAVVNGSLALGEGDPFLDHRQNNLSFEYTLFSYHRGAETRYRTQLVGLESVPGDWTAASNRIFTTLPAGSYELRVWGRDYAGNVSGPLSRAFRIRPPPWLTWWAYLSYVGLLLLIGFGTIVARTRALHGRAALLERQVQERTAQLARAHDDLLASTQNANRIFAAFTDAMVGKTLDGRYRLVEKIGEGGFGVLFKSHVAATGQEVAVKVFRPQAGNDSGVALERFRREAQGAALVHHPNAVQIFDSGVSKDDIAYVVMELLTGQTLAAELKAIARMDMARACRIGAEVADALSAAHAHGIVHRDIKPDNIFLHHPAGGGEMAKLLDFGIAKLADADATLTVTGGMVGTPAYMAPERLEGEATDGKTDVYSLGIVLYQMLTGRSPFGGEQESMMLVLHRQMTLVPPPLSSLVPTIPAWLDELVARSLRKRPEERPAAAELAQGLRRAP